MATSANKPARLTLEQDLPYQIRVWRLQRIGWGFIGVVTVAALLGLFGNGPAAPEPVGTFEGAPTAHYQYFTRRGTNIEIVLDFRSGDSEKEAETIRIPHTLLEKASIEDVRPTPLREFMDEYSYVLSVARPESGGDMQVRMSLVYHNAGWTTERLLVGDDAVELRQFVYP